MKKEYKVKVIRALNHNTIIIDKKIRGTNIIRIANIEELLNEIKKLKK